MNRKLYKILLSKDPISVVTQNKIKKEITEKLGIGEAELGYYLITGEIVNNAYNTSVDKINILRKDGTVLDISEAADTLNIRELSAPVHKHFICYPKY